MIKSFGDQRTAALFQGIFVKSVPPDIRHRALLKLKMIDAALVLSDLRQPPSNRLEEKQGDLKGFHAIRVNDQWRILFRWTAMGAEDVTFRDYH
jgi:proteic killer suppression protein